jgi:hypothetical protein
MQVCNKCKVKISSKTNICPLCRSKIEIDEKNVSVYPKYIPHANKYKYVKQIISIISIIIIATSILLNILVIQTSYWSILVSACVLYFWGLGLISFNKKINLGLKLMLQALTIPLILILMNAFATNSYITNKITWALSYATPFIILCFIFTINFIITQRKQLLKDFLLYQLALCIMGFIPLIILLFKVAEPLYPSIITALCSYTVIIYLVAKYRKIIKDEMKKKFHI